MAYYSRRTTRYASKSRKKRSKFTQVEKIAYQMGQVKRGLANPNSRVYASYVNGCNGKTRKNKKPLF